MKSTGLINRPISNQILFNTFQAHFVLRVLFWAGLGTMIGSFLYPDYFVALLDKYFPAKASRNLAFAQIFIGAFVAYYTFLRAKRVENQIRLYEEISKALLESTRKLRTAHFFELPHETSAGHLAKWSEDFRNYHFNTALPALLNVIFTFETYEFALRHLRSTHQYTVLRHRRLSRIGSRISEFCYQAGNQQLTAQQSSRLQVLLKIHNKLVIDAQAAHFDARVSLSNSFFSRIFNVFIPSRKVQNKKFASLEYKLFESKSFLGNQYDWISRFFWWV